MLIRRSKMMNQKKVRTKTVMMIFIRIKMRTRMIRTKNLRRKTNRM